MQRTVPSTIIRVAVFAALVTGFLAACEAPITIKPPEELPVERPGQERPPPSPGIR